VFMRIYGQRVSFENRFEEHLVAVELEVLDSCCGLIFHTRRLLFLTVAHTSSVRRSYTLVLDRPVVFSPPL
jgi:hypothetical protein